MKSIRGCSVNSCVREHKAHGLCRLHYERLRDKGILETSSKALPLIKKICSVSGCKRFHSAKGFCKTHYNQHTKYQLDNEQLGNLSLECEVCGSLENLNIDHDHECCPTKVTCGKCIRGVLCNNCNTALGLLHDNVALLKKAIFYLKR